MPFDPTPQDDIDGGDVIGRILRNAATLIRTHGLAKDVRTDADGALCVHGAIAMAATRDRDPNGDNSLTCDAAGRLGRYLRTTIHKDLITGNGCAPWNNRPERTADDVIAALEAAATREMNHAV